MSTEDNKTLMRRFFEEVYTKKNLAALEEFIAPNHIDHSAAAASLPVGPEGSRQAIGMMLTAFPDLHVTVEDMIAEGDKVVVRMTMRGTQQGAFGSIPPTGKQVAVSTIDIVRIEVGKIAEDSGNADKLGPLQRAVVLPSMG